ncbi:MAG TPA: hypothetical protein VFF73_07305 [Planctomycetota bacterium]|nr:hypothetical protein [Planctomycetota bacterium]
MSERARRLAAASAAGVAFLGFGLWIGGAAGRVHALVSAASSSPGISPIDGSKAENPREVVLDGQPARTRRCLAPKNMSVTAVRDHYEAIARRESRVGEAEVPYVALDQRDGAYVLWTSVKDGHRKGVVVSREAGIVSYMLLDSEALPGRGQGASSTVVLPGGARAPQGARGGLTIEDGGSSFTFFEAPGTPAEVAAQVQASLADKGFAADQDGAPVLDEAGTKAAHGRLVVPLKGRDQKGILVVAAEGRGSSRATLVLR